MRLVYFLRLIDGKTVGAFIGSFGKGKEERRKLFLPLSAWMIFPLFWLMFNL